MAKTFDWWLDDNREYHAILEDEETGRPHKATLTATVRALIKDYNKMNILVPEETMSPNDEWLSGVFPITFNQVNEAGVTDLGQAWLQVKVTEVGQATYTTDIPIVLNKSLGL